MSVFWVLVVWTNTHWVGPLTTEQKFNRAKEHDGVIARLFKLIMITLCRVKLFDETSLNLKNA